MRSLLTLCLSLLVQTKLMAQDPELLMNEARYHLVYQSYDNKQEETYSTGPAVGVSFSFINMVFGNFNKHRLRVGDLIGAGVCPLGYTTSKAATYPVYVWGRFEIGGQAYYAVKDDLDIGIKLSWYLDADWDRVQAGPRFQPVIRFRKIIAEGSFGFGTGEGGKNAVVSFKYIFLHEDTYKGLFLRYEINENPLPYLSQQWSLGYSAHFASNR